jgi:double-stranded uracil-DNA glycosylase
MVKPWKPSREQILGSYGRTVPDLILPGLKVLFSGINPSLYSAAVGHHFARPGNRFWPALHAAGFTPRLFSPFEGPILLDLGYGITNVVDRSTASADALSAQEFVEGGRRLEEKILRFSPMIVAFLGITAYRSAFGRPRAPIGLQPESIAGSILWVLPNPSGLNAHYRLADLVRLYEELRMASDLRASRPQS